MRISQGILALITLAPLAIAQIGPDVIVGDLPATSRFGPLGTVYSYSVGTTSCNLGDQPLAWVSNTNQHPVITQNIFRLENGQQSITLSKLQGVLKRLKATTSDIFEN